jgi:Na+-transporting NADH:ubiquinone oxidoreductase subunit NqrB
MEEMEGRVVSCLAWRFFFLFTGTKTPNMEALKNIWRENFGGF